jgi:hypothetical protein
MEQCNDSSFKFSTTAAVDGCGAKRLPDDIFTVLHKFSMSQVVTEQ